jgi:hypothetical protein
VDEQHNVHDENYNISNIDLRLLTQYGLGLTYCGNRGLDVDE